MLIFESIVLAYFLYVVFYTLFFSVSAFFYSVPEIKPNFQYFNFCVLIPAYQEDAVILNTVYKTIDQNYPAERLHVAVIADGLSAKTLKELRKLPVQIVPVSFPESTKVKSLKYAFSQIPGDFDYAVILDADNLLKKDFLFKVNDLLQSRKFKAVQCQRNPKNKENNLAFLDGLSEGINNRIYRQGASAVNLSSSISGSGIVVDYNLLRENIENMNSVGGFDRELELRLIRNDAKVFYYKDAFVLDEKVSSAHTFQNQRRRWISSQYFYLKKYFWQGMTALVRGNFAFFNSAILRNVQLPRLINLGLLTTTTFVLYPLREHLYFQYAWWPALLIINIVAVVIAIPRRFYSGNLIKSVITVPGIFLRMILLLFKLKGANKDFIHTPHSAKHPS